MDKKRVIFLSGDLDQSRNRVTKQSAGSSSSEKKIKIEDESNSNHDKLK
jgi:hypothetical protein